MTSQELAQLQKAVDFVMGKIGEPGYYTEIQDGSLDVLVTLKVVDGYFRKLPPPADIKPIAQSVRAGLTKRGYLVKGARPAIVRDNAVYFFTVKKPEVSGEASR